MIAGSGRRAQRRRGGGAVFLLAILVAALPAGAETREFVAGSGDWFDAENWLPPGVPSAADTVVIGGESTVRIDPPAAVAVAGLLLAGTLAGDGALRVNGLTVWSSGALVDFGALVPAGELMITGAVAMSQRTVNNTGRGVLEGDGTVAMSNSAAFNNMSGGMFEITNDGSIGPGGAVTNAGTWRRTTSGGIAVISAGFVNSGTVDVATGTLRFAGGYTQLAGVTQLTGGSIELGGGQNLTVVAGRLTGSGAIFGRVNNGGVVAPGATIGTLIVAGDYVQSAGGRLAIEIGGTAPGAFDRLEVGGTFAADGALDVVLAGAYVPEIGDRFEILTYGSRTGTFAAVIGLVFGEGRGFNPLASASGLELEYAEEVCDDGIDNDGNGEADCMDFKCAGVSVCIDPMTPTPQTTPDATATAVATATMTVPAPCVGDCDGDGRVTINELIRAVNIALESQPLAGCPGLDVNGSARIEINELILAVNNALAGCQGDGKVLLEGTAPFDRLRVSGRMPLKTDRDTAHAEPVEA